MYIKAQSWVRVNVTFRDELLIEKEYQQDDIMSIFSAFAILILNFNLIYNYL